MKTLGFIGTGGMGHGMAANLIKAGYRLVVTDLNRAQAKGLESLGAEFKDSPKAVAESCELVLSMLPNNDAVKAISLG
ncbi:MAG: 2-hydroxy-3-oxopropionate reductase, partial [Hyphomicrobiales bacterium]|nr:2-hydroxy-3-oxopropionate reductase [Hyphomicrobiales bacterium]